MGLVRDCDGFRIKRNFFSRFIISIGIQIRIENSLVTIEMLVFIVSHNEREFLEKRVLRKMSGLLGYKSIHLGCSRSGL